MDLKSNYHHTSHLHFAIHYLEFLIFYSTTPRGTTTFGPISQYTSIEQFGI